MKVPFYFWIIAFFPLAILVIILCFVYKTEDIETYFKTEVAHEQYHGRIVRKTILKNHAVKEIMIKNIDSLTNTITADDWDNLWNYSRLGDSISKPYGDTTLQLYSTPDDTNYTLLFNHDQRGAIITKRN